MDVAFRHTIAEARRQGDLYFASLLPEDRIRQAFGQASWFWDSWLYSPAVTVWVFLSQCLEDNWFLTPFQPPKGELMKVRCVQLINPNTRQKEDKSDWLSIGKVYHVLAIFMDDRKAILLRLIGDDRAGPALHNIENFEIVSPIIPSNWTLHFDSRGLFELSPESWIKPGFWPDYFDGKEDAIREFESERAKSIQSDP